MRSYVWLSILLGMVAFLTVHYSFWMVFGIMYFGGMLLVALIAFTAGSRHPEISRSMVLDDENGQRIVERQAASEDLKAA